MLLRDKANLYILCSAIRALWFFSCLCVF